MVSRHAEGLPEGAKIVVQLLTNFPELVLGLSLNDSNSSKKKQLNVIRAMEMVQVKRAG